MPAPNIIYPNLRAEMARRKIAILDIAKAIHTTRDTAGGKLAGKRPLHLDEAEQIVASFFPDMDIGVLFAKE